MTFNRSVRHFFSFLGILFFISSVDVHASIQEKILTLADIQSIAAILVPAKTATTTEVDFKVDSCPQSSTKDDALYVLQTINSATTLPVAYIPKNLVDLRPFIKTAGNMRICMTKTAASQLYKMSKDMEEKGLTLQVVSGYRSFKDQQNLYTTHAPIMNMGKYDRVALAGRSEHQLGTTADIASEFQSGVSFALSKESSWLKDNAHKYGFLISYEEGHEDKTGYMYEPWHIRYIGNENATLLRQGDYSLAFKPAYYKKSWMNTLLNRLKEFTQSSYDNDPSIGG